MNINIFWLPWNWLGYGAGHSGARFLNFWIFPNNNIGMNNIFYVYRNCNLGFMQNLQECKKCKNTYKYYPLLTGTYSLLAKKYKGFSFKIDISPCLLHLYNFFAKMLELDIYPDVVLSCCFLHAVALKWCCHQAHSACSLWPPCQLVVLWGLRCNKISIFVLDNFKENKSDIFYLQSQQHLYKIQVCLCVCVSVCVFLCARVFLPDGLFDCPEIWLVD